MHCTCLFFQIPPWTLRSMSTWHAIPCGCRENDSYILNVEHLYWTMHSQSPHHHITPVMEIVQKQQKCRTSAHSQLPLVKWRVSALTEERDSSHGGSSVSSTIQSQISTVSSSVTNSGVIDITHCVTCTPFSTQWWSIDFPTAMPGRSSRTTPAPRGISQTDSPHPILSSLALSIASTPTPLSGLANLPTHIHNPEACATITNPLRTRATERNHRQRHWQCQLQAVSTPPSVVASSRSIYRFGHWDMTHLEFATGRLLGLYLQNRWPFFSASDMETVSYATRCVAKAFAEARY